MALFSEKNLSGNERILQSHEIIVSKTDLTGKLTYGNHTFYNLASMGEKDGLGKQHNIIRHPHMPRCVFNALWSHIKSDHEIFAYVNNCASNGDNYWVLAHVTPSYDKNGGTVGYHSNRRAPDREILNRDIIPLYDTLYQLEQSIESPKKALEASNAKIKSLLTEKNMTFNEFIFSLSS